MLFNIITNLGESLMIFIFGMVIIYLISFILRISFLGKIYHFFIATIILSSIVHFTKLTIPEQNQYIVLLLLSIFYLFIFFIIKKLKKGSTRVWKIEHGSVFIIFIMLVMFIGKGEFLDNGSRIISNDISIGTSGEVFYKSFGGIKSSIGIFNEYGGSDYDTIKYDLNLDGFVDIKTIDIDENLEIDDIIVYTYNTQKFLLFILLIISIIITYIFSDGGKIKIKKQSGNNKKKINLNGLKRGLKRGLNNDENIEKNNNSKKKLSLFVLLLIFLQLGYVSAYKESDLIGTPEYIKGDKFCNYIYSLKGCIDCSKSYVPKGKKDFYILNTDLFINTGTDNCNHKSRPALKRFQYGSNIEGDIEEYIRYMDNQLKNISISLDNDISEFGTIDDEDYSNINTIIITEKEDNLNELIVDLDVDDIINGVTAEGIGGNINDIIGGELLNYLGNYEFDYDNENKGIINEIEIIEGLKIVGDNKNNINIKKKVDDALKTVKFINDGSSATIDGINMVKDEIKKIGKGGKIDKNTIGSIKESLKIIVGKDGIKGLNNLIEGTKDTGKYIKNVGGKVGGLFKGLGFLGDVIGGYDTYENARKKHKGNNSKIYTEASTKIIGKTLIGSNPIDFVMGILSGGASMIGFKGISKIIDDNTLGSRYEQIIDIANKDEGSSINQTIDSSATNFLNVYNNSKSGTFNKIIEFGKFSGVMTVGMLGFVTQSGMGVIEGGFDSLDEGYK